MQWRDNTCRSGLLGRLQSDGLRLHHPHNTRCKSYNGRDVIDLTYHQGRRNSGQGRLHLVARRLKVTAREVGQETEVRCYRYLKKLTLTTCARL